MCVNAFAVIFADPQREGYKLHSLLGSVGKRAETNFTFQPLPSITSLESKKSSRHVTSRNPPNTKREDPGNEAAISPARPAPF